VLCRPIQGVADDCRAGLGLAKWVGWHAYRTPEVAVASGFCQVWAIAQEQLRMRRIVNEPDCFACW
jgi:hypothetical protein